VEGRKVDHNTVKSQLKEQVWQHSKQNCLHVHCQRNDSRPGLVLFGDVERIDNELSNRHEAYEESQAEQDDGNNACFG